MKVIFTFAITLFCTIVKAQLPLPSYNFPYISGSLITQTSNEYNVYVSGTIDYIGPPTAYGAKITATATNPDYSYCRPNGAVNCVIPDGTGGWFIGGAFNSITIDSATSIDRKGIAHILNTGALDMIWNASLSAGSVSALLLNGTDLYIGGNFNNIGGIGRNYIAKVSSVGAGVVDPLWNPNANNTVLTLFKDGADLYVGGNFTSIGGMNRNRIAKLDPNGSGNANSIWNVSMNGSVYKIIIYNGDLIVSGSFSLAAGITRNALAKLTTSGTGSVDPTWNPNANNVVRTLILSGSDLFIGGDFTSIGGISRLHLAKISATGVGTVDPTFIQNANNDILTLAMQGNDLYVGGIFTNIGGIGRNSLSKINITGAGEVDSLWNPNPSSYIRTIAVNGSNVYVGGIFLSIGGILNRKIVKISATGIVDTIWNPNPNNTVNTMILSDTNLYLGGQFTSMGGQARNYIAKVSTNGTGLLDLAWNPNVNNTVRALLKSGNNIYIGGSFTTVSGINRNRIAKVSLLGAGVLDTSWNPNVNQTVHCISKEGNNIYMGGEFTLAGGITRNRIAKADAQNLGTVDAVWNPNVNFGAVYSIAINGSDMFIGGALFSFVGGLPRNKIAKLDFATGIVDPQWNANLSGSNISSLLIHDNKLITCGNFNNIGGLARDCLAILKTGNTATTYPAWNPSLLSTDISSLSKSGNSLYVVGNFQTTSPQKHYNLAKYDITSICSNSFQVINQSICQGDTFLFNSQNLTSAGTYYDTLINSTGCDSIISLQLSVNLPTSSTLTVTACKSFSIATQTYTSSGTYNQIIPNALGCDSAITLNLTINNADNTVTPNGISLSANANGAIYQWMICNPYVYINNETNQTFTPIQNGEFAVIVTENGCSDTSNCFYINVTGLSDNLYSANIDVFPNPFDDIVFIQTNEIIKNAIVSIQDIFGRETTRIRMNNKKFFSINMSEYVSGTYIIKIDVDGKKATKKILKY